VSFNISLLTANFTPFLISTTMNIAALIDALRNATARDSVTPASLADILQAMRDETVSGAAFNISAISAAEVDALMLNSTPVINPQL